MNRLLDKRFLVVLFTALSIFSAGASAAVVLPALDVSTVEGGTGVASNGSTLTMNATAFSIFTGGTPIDIPDPRTF